MKFYSYTNKNNHYTKAVSLNNVRSLRAEKGSGKSAIRFSVHVDYLDGGREDFFWLEEDEYKKVYKEILDLLNK